MDNGFGQGYAYYIVTICNYFLSHTPSTGKMSSPDIYYYLQFSKHMVIHVNCFITWQCDRR